MPSTARASSGSNTTREMTRNAAQAFAARSGNCLSLVIMTAAFAKELGLTVAYQKVFVDDTWARTGDIYLSIGHVNVTLAPRKTDQGGGGYRVGSQAARKRLDDDRLPRRRPTCARCARATSARRSSSRCT